MFQLRCFGGLFGTDLSLDLVWVPRGNPADAPSRFASASWREQLPRVPVSDPLAKMLSAAAKRELQLLLGPLSELAQSTLRRCPGATLHRLAPGRSPECWRRLQLLIAGFVERHPGPGRRNHVAGIKVVDTSESDADVASDPCSVRDTPELSASGLESCPNCDTPESPSTPLQEADAAVGPSH